VFLVGMFTRSRGSDVGNVIAIVMGLVLVFFLTGQHVEFLNILFTEKGQPAPYKQPTWLPKISWTWYAAVGAFIVAGIASLFRTPEHVIEAAKRRADQAHDGDDRPMALRNKA
jgi:SSS family solute:Na+ symporter